MPENARGASSGYPGVQLTSRVNIPVPVPTVWFNFYGTGTVISGLSLRSRNTVRTVPYIRVK